MSTSQPVILGETQITKALSDTNFFVLLPEYLTLKVKMQAMHADMAGAKGCSSCRKRRVVRTLFQDFMCITASLTQDGRNRLKKYIGAERLMYNGHTVSGQIQPIIF